VKRKLLYGILTEFVIMIKLITPIKNGLNETYNKVLIGKNLFKYLRTTITN